MKRTKPVTTLQNVPETLTIVSAKGHENALGFCQTGTAYLIPLKRMSLSLSLRNNLLQANGNILSLQTLQSMADDDLDNYDLRILTALFSLLEANVPLPSGQICIYLPDLLWMIGVKPNQGQEQIEKFVREKLMPLQRLVGICVNESGNLTDSLPVILGLKYNPEDNTISFQSHYLNMLIRRFEGNEVRSYCRLIKAPLHKCSMHVFENARILLSVIVQAGGRPPHLSAKTLYDRNLFLQRRLEGRDRYYQQRLLSQCFRETFCFLQEGTRLTEAKPYIRIPNDSEIPKLGKMNKTVYKLSDENKWHRHSK